MGPTLIDKIKTADTLERLADLERYVNRYYAGSIAEKLRELINIRLEQLILVGRS